MKNKKLLTLLLSGVLLLSGCSEGAAITSSVSSLPSEAPMSSGSVTSIPSEAPAASGSVSANQPSSSNRFEDKIGGGIYQIESWSLADSPQAAGISLEEMDPMVEEDDYKNMNHLLLVTMNYTSTPDSYGKLEPTVMLNNLSTLTQANRLELEKMAETNTSDSSRYDLFGSDAIYLDKGNGGRGDQNLFEMNTPEEGKSVTYTLAYSLSEDDYQAAQNGQLYLYPPEGDVEGSKEDVASRALLLAPDLKK
jgi:hypothetical protein